MLLLLFCLRRAKNYYDFFPHEQGGFSLILHQDKNRLTTLGFLDAVQDFELRDRQSYLCQIDPKDRSVFQSLVSEIGDLRGKELICKTYLEAPSFASRSHNISEILTSQQHEHVRRWWSEAQTSCLFTIGYEGLSIDAYLNRLITNQVAMLVDVRKNPISMKYGFSKMQLVNATAKAGISYIHIPDLGIPSRLRQNLKSVSAYQELFEYYFTQNSTSTRRGCGYIEEDYQ